MSPNFQLFTSLRYEPLLLPLSINTEFWDGEEEYFSPFYMLSFHRDRMLQAALHFGWNDAAARITGPGGLTHLLKRLTESLDTASQTPLRVKALMNHYGDITVEAAAAPTVQRWNLYPERLPPLK